MDTRKQSGEERWGARVPTRGEIGASILPVAAGGIAATRGADGRATGRIGRAATSEKVLHVDLPLVARAVFESPLLAALRSDHLKYLTEHSRLVRIAAGDAIPRVDGVAGLLYLIVDGVVSVRHSASDTISCLGAGELLTDAAFERPPGAERDPRAVGQCTLLQIPADVVDELRTRSPRLGRGVDSLAAGRAAHLAFAAHELFAELASGQRTSFARRCGTVELPPGVRVTEEGEAPAAAYLVLDGELEASTAHGTIGALRRGDVFGHLELVAGMRGAATITAKTSTRLAEVPRSVFSELVSAQPLVFRRLVSRARELAATSVFPQQGSEWGATRSAGRQTSSSDRLELREVLPMFEVWISEGDGLQRKTKFKMFHDALRFVHGYHGRGSVAIRRPNGEWHRWAPDMHALRNRRRAPRFATRAACDLDATPGRRHNARTLGAPSRSNVIDAGPGGACVLLEREVVELRRGDPVLVTIAADDRGLTIPAKVAWTGSGKAGLEFRLREGDTAAQYERWLDRVAQGGTTGWQPQRPSDAA